MSTAPDSGVVPESPLRTKLLNPKWYEGMLASGYEGVREIEKRAKNTMGWSATAGAVDNWVYEEVRPIRPGCKKTVPFPSKSCEVFIVVTTLELVVAVNHLEFCVAIGSCFLPRKL